MKDIMKWRFTFADGKHTTVSAYCREDGVIQALSKQAFKAGLPTIIAGEAVIPEPQEVSK